MPRRPLTFDDALVGVALLLVVIACLAFRYLPMVDLPQHYAMVSILRHHHDPAWDFARRYTFDFVRRPYATVYWLGAALAWVMPLGAAMRVTVAICTVAPFAGMWALLRTIDRPTLGLLFVVPFAFGAIWHWGFINFLLGTGLFLFGLALVVRAVRSDGRAPVVGLYALGPLLLLTHFHGMVMLLLVGPVFALAFADDRRRAIVRGIVPLVPSALLSAAFVLLTWRSASGGWAELDPSFGERVGRFVEFLGGGFPAAWLDLVTLATFGGIAATFFVPAEETTSKRASIALWLALLLQVGLYFALPLNTRTATFVSARHALLIALFLVPLVPAVIGPWSLVARGGALAVAAFGLTIAVTHLQRFDREARDFDPIVPAMAPGKRVLPMVFAKQSAATPGQSFPYLHFAAYYQAAKGGDLSHSFADVWNVPIRYRPDYAKFRARETIEWSPQQVTPEELRHFDYLLVRGGGPLPASYGAKFVTTSGTWALYANPSAVPDELPP